jgi:hypothetical protein
VGISAFSAGFIANTYGYAATFLMAIAAVGAAAVAGRFVFVAKEPALTPPTVSALETVGD